MIKVDCQKKPLVGFFPQFANLAEAGRAVMIAKRYTEIGGKVIFFSHGGRFEFLARDNGFQIIKVKPFFTDEKVEEWFKFMSLETFKLKTLVQEEWLFQNVEEEIKAFKEMKIKLLLSTNYLTCAISAVAAKIPYINIVPAAGRFAINIPDTIENPFTRLFPQSLKVKFLNWFLWRTKWHLKPINKVAIKVGAPMFKHSVDLWRSGITLATNYLEFINVFPYQQLYPKENYIGMIFFDELFTTHVSKYEARKIENEIENHIKKPGRSIMISLGSSGTKELFLRILRTLSTTNYNIIAIYTSILDESDLPNVNDNILLKKYVPSISKINTMVDLAIIHGGQGTVFTAVYAKKPVIGFPMHMEQHLNLEKLVGHGCGIMLSKKYYTDKQLISAINEVFNKYDKYLGNVQNLANRLPPPKGDKNAALKILDILRNLSC